MLKNVFKKFSLIMSILFVASIVYSGNVFANRDINQNYADDVKEAVYLGVEGYGSLEKNKDESSLKNFTHKFFIDGKVKNLKIKSDDLRSNGLPKFELQNQLWEGYIYNIEISNDEVVGLTKIDKSDSDFVEGNVTFVDYNSIFVNNKEIKINEESKVYKISWLPGGSTVTESSINNLENSQVKVTLNRDNTAKNIYITFVAEEYTTPVVYNPGQRTLKNFLASALQPVGTTLYIYGGTWDWQDDGSSINSTSIGIADSWVDFFQYQDADYSYRVDETDNARDYYPHGSWNQYYYAGIDCSGYVGWAIYNTLNQTDGNEGYVMSATKMAKTFSENGWGTYTQDISIPKNDKESNFKPGDIFSMNGHVWICLGTCSDGSIVIMHSTPSDSKTGKPGGGAQISALGYDKNCEAYKLADYYMTRYYPKWSERYDAVLKDINDYTKFKMDSKAGKFSWDLENGVITDPDNFVNKSPENILKELFGEVDKTNQKNTEHNYYRDRNTKTYPVFASVKSTDIKTSTDLEANKNLSSKIILTIDSKEAKFVVNGKKTTRTLDVEAVIRNGRTMIPMRFFAESIGVTVNYNKDTRVATFEKDGKIAKVQIDGNEIELSDGRKIKMDCNVLNINDRILIPLTNIANVFDMTNGDIKDGINQDIEWDGNSRTVTINL